MNRLKPSSFFLDILVVLTRFVHTLLREHVCIELLVSYGLILGGGHSEEAVGLDIVEDIDSSFLVTQEPSKQVCGFLYFVLLL